MILGIYMGLLTGGSGLFAQLLLSFAIPIVSDLNKESSKQVLGAA